jgi:hypothetical protein
MPIDDALEDLKDDTKLVEEAKKNSRKVFNSYDEFQKEYFPKSYEEDILIKILDMNGITSTTHRIDAIVNPMNSLKQNKINVIHAIPGAFGKYMSQESINTVHETLGNSESILDPIDVAIEYCKDQGLRFIKKH